MPVSVYSVLASLSVEIRVASHEPKPPPDTTMPNEGPKLAPTNSDTAEITNRLITLDGSTQLFRARPTAPGTFSGTCHQRRNRTTRTAPPEIRGIHHHSPDHGSEVGSPKNRLIPNPVTPEYTSADPPPTTPKSRAKTRSFRYQELDTGSTGSLTMRSFGYASDHSSRGYSPASCWAMPWSRRTEEAPPWAPTIDHLPPSATTPTGVPTADATGSR
jgi:hypothetical protein